MEFGQRFLLEPEDDSSEEEDYGDEEANGSNDDDDDELSIEEEEALLLSARKVFDNTTIGAAGGYASLLSSPNNCSAQHYHTIRFQVVIWNIGQIDLASGSVSMTFRVSLYWNDLRPAHHNRRNYHKHRLVVNTPATAASARRKSVSYQMHRRSKAIPVHAAVPSSHHDRKKTTSHSPPPQKHQHQFHPKLAGVIYEEEEDGDDQDHEEENHDGDEDLDDNDDDNMPIDIPPLSILNVSTFTVIGTPEVDMLDPSPTKRLMRWSCMYRATVVQDRLDVHQFPHDCHDISLQLAILGHRSAGQRWDRRFWHLGLATEQDARMNTRAPARIPHGLVVDTVRIPDFHFHRERGLQFQFCSQQDGSFDRGPRKSTISRPDNYLRVSLMVLRESGYYDRNIVPLLAFLNVVAAAITLVLSPDKVFFRGLLILNIAFNEVGVRLSVDKQLPSVGYEIQMQKVLNEFFFVLLALILEAVFVYALYYYEWIPTAYMPILKGIDIVAALTALGHTAYSIRSYYQDRRNARAKYAKGILRGEEEEEDAVERFSTRQPQVVV